MSLKSELCMQHTSSPVSVSSSGPQLSFVKMKTLSLTSLVTLSPWLMMKLSWMSTPSINSLAQTLAASPASFSCVSQAPALGPFPDRPEIVRTNKQVSQISCHGNWQKKDILVAWWQRPPAPVIELKIKLYIKESKPVRNWSHFIYWLLTDDKVMSNWLPGLARTEPLVKDGDIHSWTLALVTKDPPPPECQVHVFCHFRKYRNIIKLKKTKEFRLRWFGIRY